jgi:hypothetical protein
MNLCIRRQTIRLGALIFVLLLSAPVAGQRGGGPPQTPRAAAPIDVTGYWVSVVSEDWRFRMVTPPKGDFQNVPVTPEAVRVANAWDPAADERAGNQCRSYGAPAIMRVPGRLHITWVDDNTIQLETDAGMQKRLFRFGAAATPSAAPSWQGLSIASWDLPGAGGPGGGGPGAGGPPPAGGRGAGGANNPINGSLKVLTTRLRPGYLRKNGIPYSENAVLTEYFDVVTERGTPWLVVTSVVDDPKYLQQPFVLSTQFKKQSDATGWDPTPCSSTW